MEKSDIDFKKLPDAPGVYRFIGHRAKVLYVGRATSLRDRVKSYFAPDIAEIRSPLIAKVVADAKSIAWEETDSVLEAIILEAKRVKELQPIGNTDLKDNKSFAYLAVTDETFPRFLIIRERELSLKAPKAKMKAIFGPFTSASLLRDALKVIRKIFPFFDPPFSIMVDVGRQPLRYLNVRHQDERRPTSLMELSGAQEKTVRFNQAIGLYPKNFDKDAYARTVRHIILFFEGKKKKLITALERAMKKAAKDECFEDAHELKRQLFALTHIRDVSLIREELKTPMSADFRVEGYDIAHLRGASPRGVMVVIENGEPKKSDYRLFTIRGLHMKDVGRPSCGGDDYAALEELIRRRAKHREWPFPQLVVIDGGRAHLNRAKKTLKDVGMNVEAVAVVKDEKHRPREILGNQKSALTHEAAILLANGEAHRFAINKHRHALRKRTQ